MWSTLDPTYGLLQGTAQFDLFADATTSDCGGSSSCYELRIILSNTSTTQANQSSQILEGLFFDLQTSTGTQVLNATGMLSALATGGLLNSSGSTIVSGSANTDICAAGSAASANSPLCTTVAKAWQDAYSTTGFTVGGAAYSQHYGIGDAGWGLFSGNKVGNPTNGIAPGNGVGLSASSNSTITNNYPFVYGTATFVLYGILTSDVTASNVVAAYGTAPEAAVAATNTSSTPEPGTIGIVSAALLLLLASRRLKNRFPASH